MAATGVLPTAGTFAGAAVFAATGTFAVVVTFAGTAGFAATAAFDAGVAVLTAGLLAGAADFVAVPGVFVVFGVSLPLVRAVALLTGAGRETVLVPAREAPAEVTFGIARPFYRNHA